jgi:hypothetical protein
MCFLFSQMIPGLIQDIVYKSDSILQVNLTQCGFHLKKQIYLFLHFIGYHARLIVLPAGRSSPSSRNKQRIVNLILI